MRQELNTISKAVNLFAPISLEEMTGVKLMNRTDTKYVISLSQLNALLVYAAKHYRVQETLGERLIEYNTTYYDTPDWQMLRAHTTGRALRQKIRVRTYVSSNLTFIEIKNKKHGRTKKKRIATTAIPSGDLGVEAQAFVALHSHYPVSSLKPAVANTFRRITLVNNEMTERLTIDLDLTLSNLRSGSQVRLADTVVVEVKRDGRSHSPIIDWLSARNIRHCGFSKYCYGALLTDSSLPLGKMKPKMRHLIRLGLIPEPVSSWRHWAA